MIENEEFRTRTSTIGLQDNYNITVSFSRPPFARKVSINSRSNSATYDRTSN